MDIQVDYRSGDVTVNHGPARTNGDRFTGVPSSREEEIAADLIYNAMASRAELLSKFMDPRRDINDECGYPRTEAITAINLKDLHDRDPIACRVNELLPKESWQGLPEVYETEDADQTTPFEQSWKDLLKELNGQSWFNQVDSSVLWELLVRADILSGVGSFGVLLLGLNDSKELREPVDGINLVSGTSTVGDPESRRTSGRKLKYLRAFDQSLIQISRYETRRTSPRYGMPVTYNVTLNDPRSMEVGIGVGLETATQEVHWTRIIHLADNLGSSEVFGVPRTRSVLNRILDLQKFYGGSGEGYWRGAFPGYSLETHPQLGGEVDVDDDALRTAMEKYMNGFQRYMRLTGMSAKSLAPQVVDPSAQIDSHLTAICIQLGIPKRKFMGSERGELASSQDDGDWNDLLRARRTRYISPRIIAPLIDRLIMVGVLNPPGEDGYQIDWPDMDALSEMEEADLAVKKTEALSKYVSGGVESLIPPMEYLTRFLGMKDKEAEQILEAAEEINEEKEAEQALKSAEMLKQQQPPFSPEKKNRSVVVGKVPAVEEESE